MSSPRNGDVLIIANPCSTRFDRRFLTELEAACRSHGAVTTVAIRGVEHTLHAARDARERGAGIIAVSGGDGTIAAVAGQIAGSDTALVPIPTGSTNVFARGLGWPMHASKVPALLADALASVPRTLRLGSIALDDQPFRTFCVNAGVGLDAATVEWIEAHPEVKHLFRQAAFAAAAAGPGLRAFLGPPRLLVEVDGTPGVRSANLIAACGRPYTYVGTRPLDLLPRAGWTGSIEWLAMARPDPVSATIHAVRTLVRRRGPAGRELLGGVSRVELVIKADEPVPVQADGEALGHARLIRLRPGPMLKVLVPEAGARTLKQGTGDADRPDEDHLHPE